MTRPRAFKQVDVFTAVPMKGNPVAVILDANGLDTPTMQAIANWTNLSETSFVFPPTAPGADYHVRIFTPLSELPFAGHPTLGTAHAVIEAGLATPKDGRLVQQCAVGLVEVSVAATGSPSSLAFRLPKYEPRPAPDVATLQKALGASAAFATPPQIIDVGPHWVIAELRDLSVLEALEPDLPLLTQYDRRHSTTGLTVFATGGGGDITVRSFAPVDGMAEDPVCGSGNGAVAAYRLAAGNIGDGDDYTASQGRQCGRDGQVKVSIRGTDIHVGGQCVTCISGAFDI